MRFQDAEKLTKDLQKEEDVDFKSDKAREIAERNAKKFGCYVLNLNFKDIPLHEIKLLGVSIEEGVNEAV